MAPNALVHSLLPQSEKYGNERVNNESRCNAIKRRFMVVSTAIILITSLAISPRHVQPSSEQTNLQDILQGD